MRSHYHTLTPDKLKCTHCLAEDPEKPDIYQDEYFENHWCIPDDLVKYISFVRNNANFDHGDNLARIDKLSGGYQVIIIGKLGSEHRTFGFTDFQYDLWKK